MLFDKLSDACILLLSSIYGNNLGIINFLDFDKTWALQKVFDKRGTNTEKMALILKDFYFMDLTINRVTLSIVSST